MLSLLRALIDRLKLLFAARAAQELEADGLSRHAECQAELLRQADRYAAEGLHGIAANLRRQVDERNYERPLAGVLPALTHLGCAPEQRPQNGSAEPARLTSRRQRRHREP